MFTKNLYEFTRPDGGTTVSTICPDNQEYITHIRLIADEGKMLTKDGINFLSCVDVETSEGWYEVLYDFENAEPLENITPDIIEKARAYDIIMGAEE